MKLEFGDKKSIEYVRQSYHKTINDISKILRNNRVNLCHDFGICTKCDGYGEEECCSCGTMIECDDCEGLGYYDGNIELLDYYLGYVSIKCIDCGEIYNFYLKDDENDDQLNFFSVFNVIWICKKDKKNIKFHDEYGYYLKSK